MAIITDIVRSIISPIVSPINGTPSGGSTVPANAVTTDASVAITLDDGSTYVTAP